MRVHVDDESSKPLGERGGRKTERDGGLTNATLEGTHAHNLHKLNLSRQVVCSSYLGCSCFTRGQEANATQGVVVVG